MNITSPERAKLNKYLACINSDKDFWANRLMNIISILPDSLIQDCLSLKPAALLSAFIVDDLFLYEKANPDVALWEYLTTLPGFTGSIPFCTVARSQHLLTLLQFAYFINNIKEDNLKPGSDQDCLLSMEQILIITSTEIGSELMQQVKAYCG
jgi:hypothetical protein